MPTAAGMEYLRERRIDDCSDWGVRPLAIDRSWLAFCGLIRSFLKAERGVGRRNARRFWITALRIATWEE